MNVWHGMTGIVLLLAMAALCGQLRLGKDYTLPWRVVISGTLVTVLLAGLLLLVPWLRQFFSLLNDGLQVLEQATRQGTAFVFGYLGGGDAPFAVNNPGQTFILAFRALPLILVVSALSALLYHWRILPLIIRFISRMLQRSMGISGALGMGSAANIFVGMIEAPLLIRPYLAAMTHSELFALMTVGMATVAGTVMALYASILGAVIDQAVSHVLIASVISVPAALMISQLIVPETQSTREAGVSASPLPMTSPYHGAMDAITSGTLQGINLLLNITAMLIVLLAMVYLCNAVLALLPGASPLTLEGILGWLAAPLVWLIGVPWHEAGTAGVLLGEKTVLNEFIAFIHLASLPADALSEHSRVLMSYALCGFANFGSLGIMIGGLGSLIPERRQEVIALGAWSIVSGTLSTLLTAAVAGLWL